MRAVLVDIVLAIALLSAGVTILVLMNRLIDHLQSGGSSRRRRTRRLWSPAPPPVTRRPLQVVAADLRRLSRTLAAVPAGAPLVRWRALWAAYDEVLMEAAELLEVAHTLPDMPIGTSRDIERLRVLAALEGAGLVVQA